MALPPSAARAARRVALVLGGAVLIADQASKWWILEVFAPPPGGVAVTPFLNVVLVWNPGVTFGLLGMGGEVMRWVLAGVVAAIVAVLALWLARGERKVQIYALGAIIGGALGNLADRLMHGQVVDFLDFHAAGWHWPAFNLADAAIVCGVFVLLLDTFIAPRERLN